MGPATPDASTVKARRLGCFPRQTLGEPSEVLMPAASRKASTEETSRSRHNGGNPNARSLCRETPSGSPDACGGRPSRSTGLTSCRTGSLRVHQSPTAGNPPAALDSPQGAALRSDNSWHGAGSTLRET
ncbi:MAG: hypothetical protein KME49_04955 [Brasilonema octagenarum HA4186-MV1]|nr:hypothetical protein [Brasilonema octagenarum HA4186-MV1]